MFFLFRNYSHISRHYFGTLLVLILQYFLKNITYIGIFGLEALKLFLHPSRSKCLIILSCLKTYRGAKTVCLKFEASQLRGISIHFRGFPHFGKIWIFKSFRKKILERLAYPKFPSKIFGLCDLFIFLMVRKILGCQIDVFFIASRYTANVNSLNIYLSQVIRNMKSITKSRVKFQIG